MPLDVDVKRNQQLIVMEPSKLRCDGEPILTHGAALVFAALRAAFVPLFFLLPSSFILTTALPFGLADLNVTSCTMSKRGVVMESELASREWIRISTRSLCDDGDDDVVDDGDDDEMGWADTTCKYWLSLNNVGK